MGEESKHIPTSTPPDGNLPKGAHDSSTKKEATTPPHAPRVLGYIRTLLFTILVAFLLKTFVVEAFRIPSGSMENTLLVGDFLLVNKLAYGLKTPRYLPLTNLAIPSFTLSAFGTVRRGDVVVFEFPGKRTDADGSEPVYYIKRCIGIPGDTVTISRGRVLVDGREVLPPSQGKTTYAVGALWTEAPLRDGSEPVDGNNFGPIVVPKKGDDIALSPTSAMRWKELVEREHHKVQIDSTGVVFVDGVRSTSYTVGQNYYFMLGDNRGNSLDSRYWGFVPKSNIVGDALIVYWSWDPEDSGAGVRERISKVRWSRIGSLIR